MTEAMIQKVMYINMLTQESGVLSHNAFAKKSSKIYEHHTSHQYPEDQCALAAPICMLESNTSWLHL